MTAHACGTCTLCCDVVSVSEIDKPQYAPCPHMLGPMMARPGCSIYERRPHSCRLWSCLWLTDESWGDELRPDRCGFVVGPLVDLVRVDGKEWPAIQVWAAPGHEDDFSGHAARKVIEAILQKEMAVLWRMPNDRARCFVLKNGRVNYSEPIATDKEEVLGDLRERTARAAAIMARR